MPEKPLRAGSRKLKEMRELPAPIGERIREIRKAAKLTLQDVSTASGISRAALSKIERGEGSPTYDSLLKLARGLGTDLVTLVTGRRSQPGAVEVTRAGEGSEYRERGFVHHLLAKDLSDRSFFAFITDIPAIPLEDYGPWNKHDSEDFLYVLDGTVAVHLEGKEPIELGEGDSMQMDCRVAHALIALPGGGGAARLLWVSVPFG